MEAGNEWRKNYQLLLRPDRWNNMSEEKNILPLVLPRLIGASGY